MRSRLGREAALAPWQFSRAFGYLQTQLVFGSPCSCYDLRTDYRTCRTRPSLACLRRANKMNSNKNIFFPLWDCLNLLRTKNHI